MRLAPVLIQPMAADDVSSAMARVATGAPLNGIVEVAGPEEFGLDELIREGLRAVNDQRTVIADPNARYFGASLSEPAGLDCGGTSVLHYAGPSGAPFCGFGWFAPQISNRKSPEDSLRFSEQRCENPHRDARERLSDELYPAPRSWPERAYPKLIFYNKHDRGGHFAGWEEPALLSTDLRTAFRSLRSTTRAVR